MINTFGSLGERKAMYLGGRRWGLIEELQLIANLVKQCWVAEGATKSSEVLGLKYCDDTKRWSRTNPYEMQMFVKEGCLVEKD